ncbi:MAG: D-2-hydroxyacid dehydrogenase [Deltaproteobacteria bacterium]|nr:D-2-hydroxyacid dehydrogenase [Deltaproteobacteria bacterium]
MKLVAQFQLNEVRWSVPEASVTAWRQRHPQLEVVSLDDPAELAGALAEADIFFGWKLPPADFAVARQLRWFHSALAGIEDCLFPALVASDVLLTNSTGLHSTCIPEHVITQILVLSRNFHQAARLQARHEWNRFGMILAGSGIRDVNGANLAVLGAGPIGENVARLAAGLGMRVRVMRRDASTAVPHAEAVLPPSALHELLAWADFVVLAVPLTGETRHLIGAAELRAMKSTAYLINIARGEVVDQEALLACLRAGGLAGAALDVFDPEPLPADSPFWELENVVITPHVSGYMPQYFDRMLALFEDNLERFLAGRPLRNVVDKQLGYARSAKT